MAFRFPIGSLLHHRGEDMDPHERDNVRYLVTGHQTYVYQGGMQEFYVVRGVNRSGGCDPTERLLHEYELEIL